METAVAAELAELKQLVSSHIRRIENLERGQETLNRLATAVEVLAAKQDGMGQSVDRIREKLDVLEQRPAQRWEGLLDKILLVLAGAFVSFLLSQGGL